MLENFENILKDPKEYAALCKGRGLTWEDLDAYFSLPTWRRLWTDPPHTWMRDVKFEMEGS